MVEFGEKVKQVREEQGLTQQSLAERLYVTRQAVSRWECGARYPDLLTAKKLAMILGVSLDELLSQEALKENVEKEPVLAKPIENMIQTILYAVAAIIYFLLSVFSVYAIWNPNEALLNTPAGDVSLHLSDIIRVVHFIATLVGLILSVKNKLTASKVGYIMSVPYMMASIAFIADYIEIKIKNNGYMDAFSWLEGFFVPVIFTICILIFFRRKERRVPVGVIIVISIVTILYLLYYYKIRFYYFTDLGFVVTTTHMIGKICMAVLLGYQAIAWEKKKKFAYKK